MSLVAYQAAVLADDPEVYWQCQDSALPLVDSSGNGFDTNNSINPSDISFLNPGPCGDDFSIGFAGGFTESRPYRNAVPMTATNNLTLELWMRYTSGNAYVFVIGDTFNDGYALAFSGGKPYIDIPDTSGIPGISQAQFANTPPIGTFCHLVAVRDAGTWKYYYNGVLDTANAGTTAPTGPPTQFTYVGYYDTTMVYRVAHVAAYDTALSAERIEAHYDAALEAPQSGLAMRMGWPFRRVA